jgi:hypothetical protein
MFPGKASSQMIHSRNLRTRTRLVLCKQYEKERIRLSDSIGLALSTKAPPASEKRHTTYSKGFARQQGFLQKQAPMFHLRQWKSSRISLLRGPFCSPKKSPRLPTAILAAFRANLRLRLRVCETSTEPSAQKIPRKHISRSRRSRKIGA